MERNGIHIINLFKTLDLIDKAYDFIKQTTAHNGTILFVGTKKQAAEAISEQATRVGMPYVSERWLGGMLTNFQTVSKRVARMKELEEMDFDDVHGSGLTKKELLLLRREKEKLVRQLGGIRNMNRTPSALFIVDINKESLAVEEAHKLGIPVVALVDTNTDPEVVDYPIPANDDAIRGIALLTTLMADAVADGLLERSNKSAKADDKDKGSEQKADNQPLAEWETELLKKDTSEAPAAEAPKAEESEAKAE
jgi:small subunit ribosomal protein S2